MPKSRFILCLGFFIALLPVLGFPNSWDHFFDTASGLLIVLLSVLISVDRRLMLKAKAEKRARRKRAVATPPASTVTGGPVLVSEPEPVLAPSFSAPEPVAEVIPEMPSESLPIVDIPAPEVSEQHASREPRRKRRVRVFDADAPVSESPAVPETFDNDHTEF